MIKKILKSLKIKEKLKTTFPITKHFPTLTKIFIFTKIFGDFTPVILFIYIFLYIPFLIHYLEILLQTKSSNIDPIKSPIENYLQNFNIFIFISSFIIISLIWIKDFLSIKREIDYVKHNLSFLEKEIKIIERDTNMDFFTKYLLDLFKNFIEDIKTKQNYRILSEIMLIQLFNPIKGFIALIPVLIILTELILEFYWYYIFVYNPYFLELLTIILISIIILLLYNKITIKKASFILVIYIIFLLPFINFFIEKFL